MQEIYSLDFSRDGRHLVSGSGDKSARIWDIESGRCVYDLRIDDFIHNEHGPIDAGITSVARELFLCCLLLLLSAHRRDTTCRFGCLGLHIGGCSLQRFPVMLTDSEPRWKARRCGIPRHDGPRLECADRSADREAKGAQRLGVLVCSFPNLIASTQLCQASIKTRAHRQCRLFSGRQVPRIRCPGPDTARLGPIFDQARGRGGREQGCGGGEGLGHVSEHIEWAQGELSALSHPAGVVACLTIAPCCCITML